jgi:hypothetical protein
MSAMVGRSNGLTTGTIFQVVSGDMVDDFNSRPLQENIFYFKTIDLSTSAIEKINNDIANQEGIVINCFTAGDISTLEVRGACVSGIGGDLGTSSLTNNTSADTYDNILGE